MHDSQRIRYGMRDRLLARVGDLVPGGVHTGRARGIVADGKVPAILVDVFDETSVVFNEENGAEEVTYFAEACLVGDGPEPDLADGEPACCDELDDLTLQARRALKRDWALGEHGLQVLDADGRSRLIAYRYVGRKLSIQPGGRGAVAHSTLRYAITVVCEDGDPSLD